MTPIIKDIFITIISITLLIHPILSQIITCPSSSTSCHCPSISSTPGETCIFECTKEDSCKSTTLYCRAGDACEIQCKSKAACSVSLTIEASQSTNVNLICNGEDTCKSNNILKCGTGDCNIHCNGEASCEKFGLINTTNARSFQCDGQCQFSNIPNYFSPSPTIAPTQNVTITPTIAPSISNDNTQSTNIDTILEATIITTYMPTYSPIENSTKILPVELDESVSKFNFYSLNIHPLYYVIALLLILIFVVCCILACWVYISHNHTQKLIAMQKLNKHKFEESTKSVNFNPSRLNIPTADGFAASTSKRPLSASCNNNHILTPSHTSNPNIPKMLRVHSDISTIGTPNDTLTIDTIELQQCNPSKSNELDEGNAYFTDEHVHEEMTMENYYKNHKNNKFLNNQTNTNNNYLIPPPPPLPLLHLINTVPPPPPMRTPMGTPMGTLTVTKSNIPPPPNSNNNNNKLIYDLGLYDQPTETLTISKCASSDIDNIDNELSDDTIMKHLNTIDSDFDGEEDINSMKAVRHPTMSNGTQSYDISPQFSIQITTPNGMSNISLKKDNMIQAMENIKKEIYLIYNKKYNTGTNNMKDSDSFDNKIDIEIPETNDKSFESYSIGNTPRPKEYSKDSKDESSNNIIMEMDDENDRNSYAVQQLINRDEPTYTNSTMIDDTYLKYLNM